MASIAGSGPLGDISCLFGRNGREHMKWTYTRGRNGEEAQARVEQGQGESVKIEGGFFFFFLLRGADCDFLIGMQPSASLGDGFPFYEKNTGPSGRGGWPVEVGINDSAAREKYLEEYLESNWSTTAIKGVLNELDINLQREPAYSRKIFSYLLAKSVHTRAVDQSLFRFLDDLTLNIRGAGNYTAVVEHLARHEIRLNQRSGCLSAIARALELGIIPPDEVRAIVKSIPKIRGAKLDPKYMIEWYRQMWDAIGRCDVFTHGDLDAETVDAWLEILEQRHSAAGMDLALEIILATHGSDSSCSWVPKFIMGWLDLQIKTGSEADGTFVAELLNHFNPDVASEYMIRVTESLTSSEKDHHRMLLLERWQDCLLELQDVRSFICSPVWLDLNPQNAATPNNNVPEISTDHQIILRLWVLRTLSEHFGPPWKRSKHVDAPITQLFDQYEYITKQARDGDFLSKLMKDIHDLDIPFSGLMMLAVDMKVRKNMTKATRKALQRLERSRVSFADLFTDLHTYNSSKSLFFSSFEQTVCQVDVSSLAFTNHVVHLAKTGDSKSVWTLIRLLRAHTPLKVSLAKSWPVSDSPEQPNIIPNTTSKPQPNLPNPHDALEMIHILAIVLSCSRNLTPRRSFHLIHWLYNFLMTHNAPVKPSLVRAMYHAGIIRYQREGLRVASTRYLYIWELVKKFEDAEVAKELMEGPRYGVSRIGVEEDE